MNEKLYCLIRQDWVAALPEEKVRQGLIHHLTQNLGFPLGCLAVEKSLREMPHIDPLKKLPGRRADIVCFAQNIHPRHVFYPILVIECKSVKIKRSSFEQVVGYNYFLQACFIALANASEQFLGRFDPKKGSYAFSSQIPAYQDLLKRAQSIFFEGGRGRRKSVG